LNPALHLREGRSVAARYCRRWGLCRQRKRSVRAASVVTAALAELNTAARKANAVWWSGHPTRVELNGDQSAT